MNYMPWNFARDIGLAVGGKTSATVSEGRSNVSDWDERWVEGCTTDKSFWSPDGISWRPLTMLGDFTREVPRPVAELSRGLSVATSPTLGEISMISIPTSTIGDKSGVRRVSSVNTDSKNWHVTDTLSISDVFPVLSVCRGCCNTRKATTNSKSFKFSRQDI